MRYNYKYLRSYTISIVILVLGIIVFNHFKNEQKNTLIQNKTYTTLHSDSSSNITDSSSADNNTAVLSKQAVNELIKRAADQKYLQDVFNGNSKLPITKQDVPLKPLNAGSTLQANSAEESNISGQRCVYNSQLYIPGDIVKTNIGWIRCTPTILLSGDKQQSIQYGSPAWTAVQN